MPDSPEHVPVIAVASGKGGVGKTTVAVNPGPGPDRADSEPAWSTATCTVPTYRG